MRLYKAVTAIFIILNLAFTTIAQENNLNSGTSAPIYNIVRLKQSIKGKTYNLVVGTYTNKENTNGIHVYSFDTKTG